MWRSSPTLIGLGHTSLDKQIPCPSPTVQGYYLVYPQDGHWTNFLRGES